MKIAVWAIIAEVLASIAELYTMDLFLGTQAAIITVPVLTRLTGIAFALLLHPELLLPLTALPDGNSPRPRAAREEPPDDDGREHLRGSL